MLQELRGEFVLTSSRGLLANNGPPQSGGETEQEVLLFMGSPRLTCLDEMKVRRPPAMRRGTQRQPWMILLAVYVGGGAHHVTDLMCFSLHDMPRVLRHYQRSLPCFARPLLGLC